MAKAERSNLKKLIEGIPSKIIIVDDDNLALLKGRSAGLALVGFLKQVSIVFQFENGQAARDFFDQLKGE